LLKCVPYYSRHDCLLLYPDYINTMTEITLDSRVGDIVAHRPSASKTFHQYGIDFCCGGGKSLSIACSKKGVNAEQVLLELTKVDSAFESEKTWINASPNALIGHILTKYHEPLQSELPRLEAMLEKVNRVHGHVDQAKFDALLSTFSTLKQDLLEHMQKEEHVLFPLIMQKRFDAVNMPIQMMESEHEEAGAALRELRRLTDDYVAPEYACNTWRALWDGLRELEIAMHEHVHLENNVLFPRAAALN